MKHATDVRGSALIAGEVTMLRSQADVKFDTGDKEESGCLSANLARGPPWVLVPTEANAEGPDCPRRLENRPEARGAGEGQGGGGVRLANRAGNAKSRDGAVMESSVGERKTPPLLYCQ